MIMFPFFSIIFQLLWQRLMSFLNFEKNFKSFFLYQIFYCILGSNLLGLFSFSLFLPGGVNLGVVLILLTSSCLWAGGLILSLSYSTKNFMQNKSITHLVPSGTPFILIPFLVFVETVSIFIRPITLGVRLAANLVAGHMILHLVSLFVLGSFFMLLLEIMVSVLQAFVFTKLLSLYH